MLTRNSTIMKKVVSLLVIVGFVVAMPGVLILLLSAWLAHKGDML